MAGELTTQIDANQNVIHHYYDTLGRLIKRTSFNKATNETTTHQWEYDTANHGIGKLAHVTGSDGYQKTYTYNPLGLVSQIAENLPSPEALTLAKRMLPIPSSIFFSK